jgi:AcrR family transcriptional regulator
MDSRTALLHAALSLFAARGYDGVGVQEVAEAAGVAKPTLYHFFGSKRGLLEALFAEYGSKLDDAVQQAAQYTGDLALTLDRVAAAYVRFATREPVFYRLELGLYFAPRESDAHLVAVRHYAQRYMVLERLFSEAARDDGHLLSCAQHHAVTLVGIINSYIALQLNDSAVITNRVRRDIVRQFSYGIYGSPSGARSADSPAQVKG